MCIPSLNCGIGAIKGKGTCCASCLTGVSHAVLVGDILLIVGFKRPVTTSIDTENRHWLITMRGDATAAVWTFFWRNADHKYFRGAGVVPPSVFFYSFMRWFGLRFGPGPAGHESVMWQCFELKTQVSRKALEQLRQEKVDFKTI